MKIPPITKRKKQSFKTNPEMTQRTELVDKNIKIVPITVFYVFKS